MNHYLTLTRDGTSRYEEKKSVFLGFAKPVSREEDALAWISAIKRQYPDARHHVYAYLLRDGNKSRYTDDGEPSGTAGMPVLEILRKQGLTDCAVVVVRYFGGTLLGTGGLVRAYTAAASDAVRDGQPVTKRLLSSLAISLNYADYQKAGKLLSGVVVTDVVYSDGVTCHVNLPEEMTDAFIEELNTLTSGRAAVKKGETAFG